MCPECGNSIDVAIPDLKLLRKAGQLRMLSRLNTAIAVVVCLLVLVFRLELFPFLVEVEDFALIVYAGSTVTCIAVAIQLLVFDRSIPAFRPIRVLALLSIIIAVAGLVLPWIVFW